MRLTTRQHAALVDAVRRHFGPQARLWLFGSRADDGARGGDFDVMTQVDDETRRWLDPAAYRFFAVRRRPA